MLLRSQYDVASFFAKDCVIHFSREFNTAVISAYLTTYFSSHFSLNLFSGNLKFFPPFSDSLRKLLLSDVTKPQMNKYLSNDCALKLSVYDD